MLVAEYACKPSSRQGCCARSERCADCFGRGRGRAQAQAARAKLEARLAPEAFPLDYSTCLRVVRDALAAVTPPPVVVSEGANTMDNAR
jgi:hypothetical protein